MVMDASLSLFLLPALPMSDAPPTRLSSLLSMFLVYEDGFEFTALGLMLAIILDDIVAVCYYSHGYVGNKSVVFLLKLLGYDVDPIDSVKFLNHTSKLLLIPRSITQDSEA